MSAGMPSWEPAKRGAPAPIQKDKRAGAVLSIRDISITSASWEKTPCLRCCAKAPSPRADLALRLPNISSHEILPSWKGDQGPETLKYRMPREGPCSRRSHPAAHRSPAGHLQRLSEICMAHGCSPAARWPGRPAARPPAWVLILLSMLPADGCNEHRSGCNDQGAESWATTDSSRSTASVRKSFILKESRDGFRSATRLGELLPTKSRRPPGAWGSAF